jgi:hypothetical protein
MALNTHALRFVANRKMRVSLGSRAREKCSIRGIDQFTFDAHVKVGAGSTSLNQRAYVETHASRDKIRFACTPTKDNGRSVLIFEFSRTSNSSPTSYRYELPNGWDDRWHHVAFSASTGDGKYAIYFDDIKVKEGRLVGNGFDQFNRPLLIDKAQPKEISIGATPTGTGSNYVFWDGKLDNVRVYRKFVNGNTYGGSDSPIDDHVDKVGAFAPDINLIEEWRFNEGPRGSAAGTTYGVVDHQYDPKLKAEEYEEQDKPKNQGGEESQEEDDFDPGPPQIADAILYEDGKKSNNLWIGIDVSDDIRTSAGVVILPADSDRPFLGEGLRDTRPPSIPVDLNTTAITEDSFEVSWRSSFDNITVQDYQVDVSTFDNFESILVSRRTGRRNTERITGLIPGQRYYWRVRAIDAESNESAWASSTAYIPFKLRASSRINYSPNPSFEGLRHLASWESFAYSGTMPDLSVQAYTSEEPRPDGDVLLYGDNYLVVQSNGGVAGLYRGAAHALDWTANKELKASFWIRGTAEFGVYLFYMQGNRVLASSALLSLKNEGTNTSATINPLSSDWTRYSFTNKPTTSGLNRIQIMFVNTTSGEFNFNLEGILLESENANGVYFDGSHKGTLPGDAYWAVFENKKTSSRDGYLVGPPTDTTLSFENESPSVYDVQPYPQVIVQTLDFADRTAPNPPSTASVSHGDADIAVDSFIAKWTAPTENFEDIIAYELQVGLRSDLSAKDAVFLPGYRALRIQDAFLDNGVYKRVVSGLAPSTTYYYRVRAVDSNGNLSEWSGSGKPITTDEFLDTLAPSEVILDEPTSVSFDSFVANWREAVDDVGVIGYRITVSKDEQVTQIVSGFNALDVGNVLQYEVTGLQEDTTYYYVVQAYDAAGNTSPIPENPEPISVQTLVRPVEFGGFVSQRLGLESLVNVCPLNPDLVFGEADIIYLNCATEALVQFTLNRTIPRGEPKSAILNLTRLKTNNPKVFYEIFPLAVSGDPQTPFYAPSEVTYNTKPSDIGVSSSVFINQPDSQTGYNIISLDLTELVQRGGVYYGFRIKIRHEIAECVGTSHMVATGGVANVDELPTAHLTSTSWCSGQSPASNAFYMHLAGTQNEEEEKRPELSFAVDTSRDTNISVARARITSEPTVVRNLFPNPTFDMTASEFPLPNASFELSDTRYWDVLQSGMTARLEQSRLTYDSLGGSGELVITANNARSNSLGATVIHQYRIPVIKGKIYTARAFLATTNPNLKPRIAFFRYSADGALLEPNGQIVDLTAWSPTVGLWYQRSLEYQVSSNDTETAWLQVGVVVQSTSTDAAGNGPTGLIRIDTMSVTSNAQDTPLFVETLADASAVKTLTRSFDAGYDTAGAALQVKTNPTLGEDALAGAGVRLLAELPTNEGWLTRRLSNATINYVENPSFESPSLGHVFIPGGVGGTVVERVVKNGARGSHALKVSSISEDPDIRVQTVTFPAVAPLANKNRHFVGSCYVLGGYTYSARLLVTYSNGDNQYGTLRTIVVPAGEWRRFTVGDDGLPIGVTVAETAGGRSITRISLELSLVLSEAADTDYFVDGVQIEEVVNSSALPSVYCDGDQNEAQWYGRAHASISFRGAFVGAFKLHTTELQTGLHAKLRVQTTGGNVVESAPTVIGTLPTGAGWVSVRTWPLVVLGATPDYPPTQANLDVYSPLAENNQTFVIDAALITFDDAAQTYFNGSTLKGSWRQVPFSSPSEYQGVKVDARVFTRGNIFDTGEVRTWFRSERYPNMAFQDASEITTRYERDSRYADVRIPDRLRWNEIYNPSFEVGAANWTPTASTISTKLATDARSGGFVGLWTLVGVSSSTATLRTTDLVSVQAGQLWTTRANVRTPLITRATPVKLKFGLTFYDASGAEIVNSEHLQEFTITDRIGWTVLEQSVVAPSNAKWVRTAFTNVAVTPSFGLLASESVELDTIMLYQGERGRYYLDGDDATHVRWEGRRHASPSIFVFNGSQYYTFRFAADDGEGVLLGDVVDGTIQTVMETTDFVEFFFDKHKRNVTSRSIELVVPYLGEAENEVTLTGTYRRTDAYERFPLLVEVNQFRNEAYLRADDLAQNREYVIEIEAVASDPAKLRGEREYATRVSSGVRDAIFNDVAGDGTIKFAGFALNGPESKYYWVSEHDSFSLPERRTQIETIPRMDGGIELKPYWGTKKISMSGGVWGNSRAELYDNVNALRAALVGHREKLEIDTLASNRDYYHATCTDFSVNEVAGESLNSLQWSAGFECADPFLYRGEPRVSTFDVVSSKPNNTVELFYTEDQKFTVFNGGTVNAQPKLTLAVLKGGGEYAVSFVNETTGQRLMPKAVMTRNDAITAETVNQTVFKNQSLPLDYVGSFIDLRPGPNVIRASIKDLKASRHNLLLNPGVERGPSTFGDTDDDGIRRTYAINNTNKIPVAGITVTRNRFQTATSSDYAAKVECDGLQVGQGVVFSTRKSLAQERFADKPTERRTFAAAAYVRADASNNRQLVLDRCFVRIWYMDGTYEDRASTSNSRYSLNTQWKLIQLPKLQSQAKAINYVEVFFQFDRQIGSGFSFYIDNVLLTQDDLAADQLEAAFQLTVSHQERFI